LSRLNLEGRNCQKVNVNLETKTLIILRGK
jgi:hypothetical protein